jgi:inner membrane protein
MDWLSTLEAHWFWLILAAILGTAEILVPGFFLIWLAAAAAVTGIAAFLLPIGPTAQGLLFAVLAVASVYAGRRWFVQNPIESDDPKLNNRGARLTGEIVTVIDPITNGRGRVKVGDSIWNARGPDTSSGAQVRVTGADGAVLRVESL